MSDFLKNSVRRYPVKLKLGMLDNMNNTFRNTVFEISVDVPLTYKTTMHINAFLPTDTAI